MKYLDVITLKNGKQCILRNAKREDGESSLEVFIKSHEETDYLASYPDEIKYTIKAQGEYIQNLTDSKDEIELLAIVDDKIVGMAGLNRVSKNEKTKHRAQFGILVLKDYWNLGIGKALLNACIKIAKLAGYIQIELDVVKSNINAINLYKSFDFETIGEIKYGFKSRYNGFQPLLIMIKDLTKEN